MPKRTKISDMQTADDVLNNYIMNQKKPPVHTDPIQPSKAVMFLEHNMRIAELPEIDMTDRRAVHKRVGEYFNLCREDQTKPTFSGLAMAFRLTREQFTDICNGKNKMSPKWMRDEFSLAKMMMAAQMEDYMQEGQINAVAGIWLMKNNFGYKDQQEIVVTPGVIEEDIPEAELIQEAKLLGDS